MSTLMCGMWHDASAQAAYNTAWHLTVVPFIDARTSLKNSVPQPAVAGACAGPSMARPFRTLTEQASRTTLDFKPVKEGSTFFFDSGAVT